MEGKKHVSTSKGSKKHVPTNQEVNRTIQEEEMTNW